MCTGALYTRLRNGKQFPPGGIEHEFLKVIIIQIESLAAWLSNEGVCVSYLITGWREGWGGVATFHDEIGSGLSAARVKGGGGKLSIIAVQCTGTMYHRHQGQVISPTIDYTF